MNLYFVKDNQVINSWNDIQNYFVNLEKRPINSVSDLEKWLADRSELDAFLEEDLAWRYIKMNCNTEDQKLSDDFELFVTQIEPLINEYVNILDKKFIDSKYIADLDEDKYFVLIRNIKKEVELYRQVNIPIFAELQTIAQEYAKITSKMSVIYQDKELTLQQANNYLKNTNREIRKDVYFLINNRRAKDYAALQILMTRLIKRRHKIAENCEFTNFRDYKHISLGRFDYSVQDCLDFHLSIKNTVLPIIEKLDSKRQQKLLLDSLKPWDLDVDLELKPPLKPFADAKDLIDKTISCFSRIRPKYGEFIATMRERNFLDLDSRKNKAPGGFNYPLYKTNIPFIFMNATGNQSDLTTMVHEGGHAIHSFLSHNLELVNFKSLPSEVAELASMSMELISMDFWDSFYSDAAELKRAKEYQLQRAIRILPWIATVDKFQHWLYTNPFHSTEDRMENWTKIAKQYTSKVIDWQLCEWFFVNAWQSQLHIFEVPFYYIEYAIAQLGAIAIWKNYKQNPEQTLDNYEKALALGYSKPIKEIYRTAGIQFDFSEKYLSELMEFVNQELEKL